MTEGARELAGGYFSGPTYPSHDFGPVNGVKHPRYSDLVEEKFAEKFKDQLKSGKLIDEKQLREFIQNDLENADKRTAIGKFNSGIQDRCKEYVKRNPSTKLNKPSQMTVDQLKQRGRDYMKRNPKRFNVPAKTSTLGGVRTALVGLMTGAAASSVSDALGAVTAASRTDHLRRAVDAIDAGDVNGARIILLGMAHDGRNQDGLYDEIVKSNNPRAALAFQHYVEALFEHAR